MKIAYLAGQYPKVSHTFIRREIAGLERAGVEVLRFAARSAGEELVDARDRDEARRTEVLVDAGAARLGAALLQAAFMRPVRFWRALRASQELASASPRGRLVHLAYLAEACLLRSRLARAGAAHLHAHFATNAASVALLCRLLGGPSFSFTVHNPDSTEIPDQVGLALKAAEAAFVVAVSERVQLQLWHWLAPADREKVHVIRSVPGESFRAPEDDRVPHWPQVVCVARMTPEKGHFVLLEALRELADRGCELELVLVGDGPLRRALEDYVREHRLQRRVSFDGARDESGVRRRVLESRALVLASYCEGLPVVLIEALRLGRPVVCSAVGAAHELVEHGTSGWLVPAGSVPALARALSAVVEAPVERLAQMGRAGARRVAELHDEASETAKLLQLLSTKTAARPAPRVAEPARATLGSQPARP